MLLFPLLLVWLAWPAAAQQDQNTQEQGSASGANPASAKIGDNEAVTTGKSLRIIDKNLVQKGKIKFRKKITAVVALSKNMLIVITGEGLFYVDVTDPTKPTVTGFVPIYGGGVSVSLNTQTSRSGQALANVCRGYNGFACCDISNPNSPSELGHIPSSPFIGCYDSCRLDQTHCVAAAGPAGFIGINTSVTPPAVEGFRATPYAQSICRAGFVGDILCGVDNYPAVMRVLTPTYDTDPLARTLASHVTGFNQLSTMSLPGIPHIVSPFPSPPLGKPALGAPRAAGVATPVRVLVAADYGGVHIVNLTNPNAPVLERTISIPGAVMNVNTDGTTTLVHLQSGKTLIYDTTDQANWVLRKTLVSGLASDAVAQGSRLYVASSNGVGLQAYDLSNLGDPPLLGYLDNTYYGVLQPLDANTLLAGGSSGLTVLDVSNPAAIQQKGSVSFSFTRGIARYSHYAMLSGGGFPDNLCVVDITTPTQPKKVNSFRLPGSNNSADAIAISGNYAYVAAGPPGVVVYRLDNPTSWSQVTTIDPPVNSIYGGFTTGVAVYGSILGIGDSGNGLHLYDISNPAKPVWLFSDTSIVANHLAMDANNVYVSSDILRVYDIQDPRHAHLKATSVTPDLVLNCRPVKGRVYVSSGDGGVTIVDLLSRAADWGRYR